MIIPSRDGCALGPATWRDMPPKLVGWGKQQRMATDPEEIGRGWEALMAPLKRRESVH
jgi:hypothetical protein